MFLNIYYMLQRGLTACLHPLENRLLYMSVITITYDDSKALVLF